MTTDLKKMYRKLVPEAFPSRLELSFDEGENRQTMIYEKVTWQIGEERKGLRYGENPGQPAALYRLLDGNLAIGDVVTIEPGRYLASNAELLQSGKHPGKINITDADGALNILRYLTGRPAAAIMKHNNPCGAAHGESLAQAYYKANRADRLAAFGGCIGLNRTVDVETAELIRANYAEVVVAPDFEGPALDILKRRKNLRVMRIDNMARLEGYASERFLDLKSLMDGGLIAQFSYVPEARSQEDYQLAETTHQGQEYKIERKPSEQEYQDMHFGWMVEAGVTSNSVIYVKDGVTVGIGTGEQDRVGVAEIARDKAYRKLADWLCFERHGIPYNTLDDAGAKQALDEEVATLKGGLKGSVMVSDAFFPFPDGVEVGLKEGVSAVVQPGGSQNDHEAIVACNRAGATMVFTGQRSFKH